MYNPFLQLPTDPIFWLAAIIAVTALGLSKGGLTGLGGISTPLLALMVPPLQAVAILQPVLILMDYKMPILTAAEILEKLAGDNRYTGIPKLVWSTSDRAEYVDRCLQHGAAGYFAKPSSLAELAKIVDRMTLTFRGAIAT